MKKFKGLPKDIFDEVCDYLESLNQEEEMIVWINKNEIKETRTITQNSMFYGLFTEIGNHLGEKTEDVKLYFLAGCFGTKKVRFSKMETEIPNIYHTSELTKEQAIFFIDTILKFIEIKDIPCKYTPRDIQSLYESYNNI